MSAPKPLTRADLPATDVDDITALRLAAIVESSDDAIVSKNLDSIIQTWNRGAERMFGYTAAEAIGRSIRMIIPADRQAEEDEVLCRLRTGDTIDHYETIRVRKDGTMINVSLTASPLRGRDGRIIGASKIARDITDQKRLVRELEEASRLKDEFLATLSHELRTPLNAVLGYIQMLRTPGIDPEARERAEAVIERNGRLLTKLVADIFDMSAIASGKVRLNLRDCDVVPVLEGSIDGIRPTADTKGVALGCEVAARQALVRADPDRLQQVFWNLLANAVKFTPRGGRIDVTLATTESEVQITVADTGAGIERAVLPYVFQRFRQGNITIAQEQRGLGLGLALVRHFVELHGGTVQAESEGPWRGATFRVNLPLKETKAAEVLEHPGPGGP
jgi:PAS domain S-box-containing protein